jgi:preprotein translocase SecE subunit
VAEAAKKPKKRQLKKVETVRERASKATEPHKPRRLRVARTTAAKPLKKAAQVGRKEYYLPLPDNRIGRFLNKRRRFIPKYFRESWQELRNVTWPNRRQTLQLTVAVFIFAIFFSVLITAVDYGLDKVFKNIVLK